MEISKLYFASVPMLPWCALGLKESKIPVVCFFSVLLLLMDNPGHVFTTRGNPHAEYVLPCGLAASVFLWDTHSQSHTVSNVLTIEFIMTRLVSY